MASRDSILLRYRCHNYVIELAKTFGGWTDCTQRNLQPRGKTLNWL